MANKAKRTEHAGAKNGGGYHGHRADAKRESAKSRREADRRESLTSYDPMKREQFRIGCVFYTGSGAWICTDIGTRTVIASDTTWKTAFGLSMTRTETSPVMVVVPGQ